MKKFKKYIPYFGWSFFIVLLVLVMGFVKKDREEMLLSEPEIKLEAPENMVFLTQTDVLNRLRNMHLVWEDQKFKELDIDKVELALNGMPEVKSAKVFFRLDGKWEISCVLREPIVRLIDRNGESFYLDRDKKVMPISRKFSARVIPVTGEFDKADFVQSQNIIHNEALINKNLLDQVYALSDYVCKDVELSSLITQIYLTKEGDFELITLLGDQKVIFGKAEDIPAKFEKLKLFYKYGIPKTGWDNYKEINVQYKDQIVCTKKE